MISRKIHPYGTTTCYFENFFDRNGCIAQCSSKRSSHANLTGPSRSKSLSVSGIKALQLPLKSPLAVFLNSVDWQGRVHDPLLYKGKAPIAWYTRSFKWSGNLIAARFIRRLPSSTRREISCCSRAHKVVECTKMQVRFVQLQQRENSSASAD